MLSAEQKKSLALFINDYRGWVAFGTGFLTGLFIALFTHNWQLLSISAILAGLFATSTKKGLLYGICSVLAVYGLFLTILLFTTPTMQIMNIFIGIVGLTGMGWIVLLITLLIGFFVGLTGGFLGSSLHLLIKWPEWT